ncbi:conserved hypothetical protein [Paenibacillus curdlanolyticus YK9]|uniref:Carrier domain-containing protein n=1 Tax=Paenibacillus curdlanolyticus YK9 TaxID=717606 RepID=E0I7F5_9BACL|nr:phosphopantetheine-binding protein [Paenibacillus curdlanolyticus]EFM11971.1 conserved hypothetical protein [Paenibacillus curdlanolyticus YK9]
MAELLERRVKEILSSHVDIAVDIDRLEEDAQLDSIGVNSINFIRTVLDIEGEFAFQFDIDFLGYESFGTVSALVSYVRQNAS